MVAPAVDVGVVAHAGCSDTAAAPSRSLSAIDVYPQLTEMVPSMCSNWDEASGCSREPHSKDGEGKDGEERGGEEEEEEGENAAAAATRSVAARRPMVVAAAWAISPPANQRLATAYHDSTDCGCSIGNAPLLLPLLQPLLLFDSTSTPEA